jgi:jumonji domain-containing protein 7
MKFGEVLDALERPPAADAKAAEDPVLYVQKQNDNLHTEFEALLKDVVEPSWATAAFESRPDAVNLWIGDDRSVSTLHKDPYDNIYCVVAGTKTYARARALVRRMSAIDGARRFTLRPPCDLPFVGYKQRPVGTWRRDPRSGAFTAEVDRTAAPVHWCDWEPVEGRNQGELTVEVRAGDALFIPSLWFHRVAQRGDRAFARGRTIAVNFWFDMRYDSPHYVYYRFLEKLVTGE